MEVVFYWLTSMMAMVNIAVLACAKPDQSLSLLNAQADKLQPYNPSSLYLMMRAVIILNPAPQLPEHLRYFNQNDQSDQQAIHLYLPHTWLLFPTKFPNQT